MELILHIGMGKTGSSSIQFALSKSSDLLHSQGVCYLGMWFDLLDREFAGVAGQQKFFSSSAEEMSDYAGRFLEGLKKKASETGASRFIISNEEFYGQIQQFAPFITALRPQIDIRIIVYVRDPREWLPSAYNQWSIFHKNYTGPIRPYSEMARQLVAVYYGFQQWGRNFQDLLTVRQFDKSKNVVKDFANVLTLDMEEPSQRTLERVDADESLLRAIYNNRLPENTLPSAFDDAFRGINISEAPRILELAERSFNYSVTDEVISEFSSLFLYIRDTFGIDLLSSRPPPERHVDVSQLRSRALEHLLHIVMYQADQIKALERAVADLKIQLVRR